MKLLINSLPKSGTNMVQKLIELAGYPYSKKSLAASSCFGRYGLAKHFLRSPASGETPLSIGLEVPVVVSPKWVSKYLVTADGYVSGHAPYSDHFYSILNNHRFKTIQVVRHPAAVLVSWARYIVEEGYYWDDAHAFLKNMSLDERVEFLVGGGSLGDNDSLYYRSFSDVLLGVKGWFDAEGVLVVRFEDLVGAQGGGSDEIQRQTIESILKHIGYEYGQEDLDKLQKNLYGGTHTFRSGRIDSWKDVIDDELNHLIIQKLKDCDVVKKLGYTDFLN